MKQPNQRLTAVAALAASIAVGGCGGNDDSGDASATCGQVTEQLGGQTAPRLMLSAKMLATLRTRAQAKDPAWLELSSACDKWAGAAVNAPSGPAYGAQPTIASGYYGDGYVPPLLSLGVCYRTMLGINDAAAAKYAAQGAKILEAMSTPESQGGQKPGGNHGYGIRNYGYGMALGYDWLRPAISATLRTRVAASLGAWLDWYDASGFTKDHPIANYFAGYFQAKAFAGLAFEGDDPKGKIWFDDASTRLWGKLVKPMYAKYMKGGGWPEGWGYGPKAVRSIAEVFWGVQTAKQINWGAEVPHVRDQAAYISYYAWPALNRMDDQGTIRSGNSLAPSPALVTTLALALWHSGDPTAPQATSFANDVLAKTSKDDREPWQRFFWDSALPKQPYTSRPTSYFADGPGHVAMRSSWNDNAVWASLSGGRYINAIASGEQMFNAGGIAVVVGDSPLLVNATGWIPHTADTAGENYVYEDSWGSGGRRLYNTFFVSDAANPKSPGQNSADPETSQARIDRYDEGGSYVRARAVDLEDQYGAPNAAPPVQSFTRDMVFMRPGSIVIRDLTTVASASADYFLGFHVPTTPTAGAVSDPSYRRFDVSSAKGKLGSLSTLLPASAVTKTQALPGGTTRIEVRPSQKTASQQWLSVVSAGAYAADQVRLSSADGNVLKGAVVGVELHEAQNQVVLFADNPAAPPSSIEYVVAPSADADHVLVDLAPSSTGYAVTTKKSGADVIVSVTPGGSLKASSAGVLSFEMTASGQVKATSAPEPGAPDPGAGGSGGSGASGGAGGSGGSSAGGAGGTQPEPTDPEAPGTCAEWAGSLCVDDQPPLPTPMSGGGSTLIPMGYDFYNPC